MLAYLAFFGIADFPRCAALWRAASLGLLKSYRWFVFYASAGVLQTLGRLLGDRHSVPYANWWTHTAPALIAFSIAATFELWFLVMRRYAGVKRIYNWLIPAFLGIAAVFTALSAVDLFLVDWHPTIYRIVSLVIRYSASFQAVICSLLFLWTLAFPEQISSNVRRHAAFLATNHILISSGYFIIGIAGGRNEAIGNVLFVVGSALYLVWALMMTAAGERIPPPPTPTDEEIQGTRRQFDDLGRV